MKFQAQKLIQNKLDKADWQKVEMIDSRQARNLTLMCTELPDGGHYIWLLAAMREFITHHSPKCKIPNLSI